MTSIEWLTISGIRSFDPHETQTIKFFKPLTIILGQNGAGKTTIIECLKVATTGDCPPSTNRGRSFIHDPKVDGNTEVKGQIRLQFRSANKKQMVTVRSFQLQQKAKTVQFKQLDAAIQTRKDDGEVVSHSYKCTEMDKLVPEMMGVSTAILDNVIFCHQEDVNWPLSESSVLKKKFDDIFASTRYSKALDVIKKTNKEQTASLKDLQKELAVFEAHRENATKLKKEANDENMKLNQLKEQLEKCEKQIEALSEDVADYDKVAEKLQKLNEELRNVEASRDALQKIVQQMYSKLPDEFEESDEELMKFKSNFAKDLQDIEKKRESTTSKIRHLEQQKEQQNQQLNNLQKSLGGLTMLSQQHHKRVAELSLEVETLAKKNSISGFAGSDLTAQQILSFVDALKKKMSELKSELAKVKSGHSDAERGINSQISTVQGKINNLTSSVNKSQSRLSSLQRQEDDAQRQFDKLDVSENQMQELSETVSQAEQEYQEKQKEINELAVDKLIQSLQVELTQTNQKRKQLDDEMRVRDAEKVVAARVTDMKQEIAKIDGNINELIENAKRDFADLLEDKPVTADTFETTVSTIIKQKREQVSKATLALQQVEKQVAAEKSKLDSVNLDLQKLSQSAAQKEQQIRKVIAQFTTETDALDVQLPAMIEKAKQSVEDIRVEVSMTDSLIMCYERFVKYAKQHHACQVCERGLDDHELENFEHLQNSKLEKAPRLVEKKKQDMKVAQETVDKLSSELVTLKVLKDLQDDKIPARSKEKEVLADKLQTLSEKMDEFAEDLASAKSDEEKSNKMQSVVNQMRVFSDSKRSNAAKLQQAEKELLKYHRENAPSFEDLRQQSEACQIRADQLNSSIEKSRKEQREKTEELSRLSTQKTKAKDQYQQKQLLFQKKSQLKDSLTNLQKEKADVQKEISELQNSTPELQNELQGLKNTLNTLIEQHKKEQNEMDSHISAYQKDIASIETKSREVKNYLDQRVEDKLENVQNDIKKLSTLIEKTNSDIETTKKESDELVSMFAQQSAVEQSLNANIEYRARKKEADTLVKKSDDLRQKLTAIGGENNFDEKDIQKKKEKRNKLLQEKANINGKRTTLKTRITKIKEDLETNSNYEKIEQRYRAALIKLKTTEMVRSDLEKYYHALDKALMRYHAMKMAEINEMMKELWQKTYRGNDIDAIEIRADAETSGTGARRQYNYRVVMKKGDVALDMRGRCSAGQKVLACLVIRLALAESFALDMPVLALDEPTTNLDSDTVQSLADALQTIINERRKMTNFQLIVITHDEDFVNKLGQSKFVDHYYRVSKSISGHSVIERQNFVN